jgi:hypothetical protein
MYSFPAKRRGNDGDGMISIRPAVAAEIANGEELSTGETAAFHEKRVNDSRDIEKFHPG